MYVLLTCRFREMVWFALLKVTWSKHVWQAVSSPRFAVPDGSVEMDEPDKVIAESLLSSAVEPG